MNLEQLQIRRGRLDDLPTLAAFTQNTFPWGDYITSVWARWVESKHGDVLVAEAEGQFAGTARVSYLGAGEAWLEGVRVHPAFRRQNIATHLIQTAHAQARQKKCHTVRLETSDYNVNARRLFDSLGYRFRAEFMEYRADAHDGALSGVRAAKLSDAEPCVALWQTSWLKRSTRNLIPAAYGWRWWEFSATRLRQAIRAHTVWLTDDATAFMVTRAENDFKVILLVGKKRGGMQLLRAAQVLAQRQNFSEMYWMTLNHTRAHAWAQAAALTLDETGMLLYEYVL